MLNHLFSDSGGLQLIQLGVERQEKLNRTKEPCGHSFTNCIDAFLAKNVGCTLLENNNKPNLPKCKTLNEIQKFENMFTWLLHSKKNSFRHWTGCFAPCTYLKYSVLYRQQISPVFGFLLHYAVGDLTVVKEVMLNFFNTLQELLYPFSSFLAEFGGALGLFLGFSFAMFWDFAFVIFTIFGRKIS